MVGFEPTCLKDNGFQDRRINHSATCAICLAGIEPTPYAYQAYALTI